MARILVSAGRQAGVRPADLIGAIADGDAARPEGRVRRNVRAR